MGRNFIDGRNCRLETDHIPLLQSYDLKKGLPTHAANGLQRRATY